MRIERLWGQSFRNLKPMTLVAQAPTLVLRGNNAQGKTNILEAIYLSATGRSFRQAAARDLVQHGASHARVQANFHRSGVRHEIKLDWAPGPQGATRQRIQLDGRGLRQLSQLLHLVNVVAFFPEDLAIAKGSPEMRRRFFDRAVAGGRPAFVAASMRYHRALKARNALLRAPSAPPAALLRPYDVQLVQAGSIIHALRWQALAELGPEARALFRKLMPKSTLRLGLHSGIAGYTVAAPDAGRGEALGAGGAASAAPFLASSPDVAGATAPEAEESLDTNTAAALLAHDPAAAAEAAAYADALGLALAQGYPRDRARGMTLTGPHRADLLCQVDGHDARTFASQGQQRALVLALKIAELSCNQRRLGTAPILLLDDVSSELDAERSAALFSAVARLGCQVWLSTTGSVELPLQTERQIFDVADGEVVAEARHTI